MDMQALANELPPLIVDGKQWKPVYRVAPLDGVTAFVLDFNYPVGVHVARCVSSQEARDERGLDVARRELLQDARAAIEEIMADPAKIDDARYGRLNRGS